MNARQAAFLSLEKMRKSGSYSNLEINSSIEKYGFSDADRAFYTRLVYGVTERMISLDRVIGHYSARPCEKIDPDVLTVLRMGAYQLLYMDSVTPYAAVNESVALVSKSKKSAGAFVNALLRRVAEKKDEGVYPDASSDRIGYLSAYYSYPEWLCRMWSDDYGYGKCESILKAQNEAPFPTLRVNTLKTTREELISGLKERGIFCREGDISPFAVRLDDGARIGTLDETADGRAFVQDEASQACALTLGAKKGDVVIDVCSCPGGKSFSLAIGMENSGKVYSFDLHASKLSLVGKGAKRLGIDIIETREHDSTKTVPELEGKADRVLVDAPCSGLGVIAKKPELRYKDKSAVERLPEIQYSILSASSRYLKPGGRLVYSTCTLNIRENEEVARRFLDSRTDFRPVDFALPNGKKSDGGMLTLFPDTDGTDGFFISLFEKVL